MLSPASPRFLAKCARPLSFVKVGSGKETIVVMLNWHYICDCFPLQLVSGVYVLRLTVSSEEGVELGVGVVNVTVNPPVWVKTRPVPIIRPMQHLSVSGQCLLPSTLLLVSVYACT